MKIITYKQATKQIDLYVRTLKDIEKTLEIEKSNESKIQNIEKILTVCINEEKKILKI